MSNGAHRVLWTVVGLLFTAIGVAGLIASLGHLPGVDPDAPLIWSGLRGLWRAVSPWGLIILAALGLSLGWLGYTLLRRQLRARRGPAMGDLDLRSATGQTPGTGQHVPGVTRVRGGRLVRGLERDLVRDPLVHQASVILGGTAPRPELWIELRLSPQARIDTVREHVGAAVDRFRVTSGLRPACLDVTARIDRTGQTRVR